MSGTCENRAHVPGSTSVAVGMEFFSIPIWVIWIAVGIYFVALIVIIWQLHD